MRKYYTVIVQWGRGEVWTPQYGSFSKQDCIDELEDSFADAYKTRIISTAPEQSAINAAIARLNQ